MTISGVGHFRYPHVDDTDIAMGMDFDFGVFPEESDTGLNDSYDPDYQEGGDDVDFGNEDEERLWWPFGPEEPVLDSDLLVELDTIADQLELTRLQEMSVLVKEEDLSPDVELGGDLTARFVRTWRKKSKGNEDFWWYRRSRLVAREFNKLCVRDDLYAPASNHIVERLVPALCLSNTFSEAQVLGALDISDAYLQVPQEVPRRISILDGNIHSGLVINKCLPGQRDGSRRWFDHFSSFLTEKLKLSPCLEQPALFKIPMEDGGGALLVHVDDVLFVLDEKYLLNKFMPAIRETFKAAMEYAPRTGGSFSFLKRLHVLEAGYSQLHIYAENKHINQAYGLYAKHSKPPRVHATPAASHVFHFKDTPGPPRVFSYSYLSFNSRCNALYKP